MKFLFRFAQPSEAQEKLSLDEDLSASSLPKPDPAGPGEADGADEPDFASTVAASSDTSGVLCRKFGNLEFEDTLEQHRRWLDSSGRLGTRADFTDANLQGADWMGVSLAGANLFRANLQDADLLMADLHGAYLTEADLRGANLVGTNLREASLDGAKLDTSTGLLAPQLAGASLLGATLPDTISPLDGLKQVQHVSRNVLRLLATVAVICALSWLLIAKTKDAQLLNDTPLIPIPGLSTILPMVSFYLIGPILLVALYVWMQLLLQRLWDALGEAPAVFPSGRRLDECISRFVMALARNHLSWPFLQRSPLFLLESLISGAVAYALIPATMVLFWARYLTEQDWRGTLLQIALLMVVAMLARTVQPDPAIANLAPHPRPGLVRRILVKLRIASPAALTFISGILLLILSVGIIWGAPHDVTPVSLRQPADYSRWAADVFWVAGYNPFAEINEARLSTIPGGAANWTGSPDDLKKVRGARLEDARLRYAQAYSAFLVNARLLGADLDSSYLSQADLRGANLRQASLRSAVLDRVQLNHANLTLADLTAANLARADLREADFTSATLIGAVLVDANLNGAVLYGAKLDNAILVRATLEKADLRGAVLNNANFARADLRGAYLDSAHLTGAGFENAHLDGAFLDDTDVRGAYFRGAIFQGAILSGANFSGADLSSADFRGALQVTPSQICSASNRSGILLDDALAQQVASLCGSGN